MSSALYKTPYEAGKEEGKAEGIAIGKEEGITIGKEEGITIGKEEGINIGKEEGIAIGKEEGKIELVEKLLTKKFGILPAKILKKLSNAKVYYLNLIVENIFDLNSLAEVEQYLDYSLKED